VRDGCVREHVCSRAGSASGKADAGGRDLLSLLVRANMSENAAQRLSDDEVLARASHIRSMRAYAHRPQRSQHSSSPGTRRRRRR
jgi:hypothetical protein